MRYTKTGKKLHDGRKEIPFNRKSTFLAIAAITLCFSGYSSVGASPAGTSYTALTEVNDSVNRTPYISDEELHGKENYFDTLDSFFSKGGDCEEFSLAKYAELRESGVPANEMYLVAGNLKESTLHNVLWVKDKSGGSGYILDSLSDQVSSGASFNRGFTPLYGYNENGTIVFVDERFDGNVRPGKFSGAEHAMMMSVFDNIRENNASNGE